MLKNSSSLKLKVIFIIMKDRRSISVLGVLRPKMRVSSPTKLLDVRISLINPLAHLRTQKSENRDEERPKTTEKKVLRNRNSSSSSSSSSGKNRKKEFEPILKDIDVISSDEEPIMAIQEKRKLRII